MKKYRLIYVFTVSLLLTMSAFRQDSNKDEDILGCWQLDVIRDKSGAMIDFAGGSEDPCFYKHIILEKEKITVAHYDSRQISGTWTLSDKGLLTIQLNGKTLRYKMKKEKNNLVLENDIVMDNGSIYKAFGYYTK